MVGPRVLGGGQIEFKLLRLDLVAPGETRNRGRFFEWRSVSKPATKFPSGRIYSIAHSMGGAGSHRLMTGNLQNLTSQGSIADDHFHAASWQVLWQLCSRYKPDCWGSLARKVNHCFPPSSPL